MVSSEVKELTRFASENGQMYSIQRRFDNYETNQPTAVYKVVIGGANFNQVSPLLETKDYARVYSGEELIQMVKDKGYRPKGYNEIELREAERNLNSNQSVQNQPVQYAAKSAAPSSQLQFKSFAAAIATFSNCNVKCLLSRKYVSKSNRCPLAVKSLVNSKMAVMQESKYFSPSTIPTLVGLNLLL